MIINHYLLKSELFSNQLSDPSVDIHTIHYHHQSYHFTQNAKLIIQHLSFLTNHNYYIIFYSDLSALNQLTNINIINDYAKKFNLTLNIYGIISSDKTSERAIKKEKEYRKLN